MSKTAKQEVGKLGEDLACRYLSENNYQIIDRNYLKKWGEIDIVARKDNVLVFIEVKSVSRERVENVSGETSYRAEDNMHKWKLDRLKRVITTYLIENEKENVKWEFGLITVYLSVKDKVAKVNFLKDIVL